MDTEMSGGTKAVPTETFTLDTDDGATLRLTRHRGGSKGPVMLVHGAGVYSGMFALDTVEESFASYLARHGYDVWRLDWRASIQLPLRQHTLDDAATYDFPAAVRAIRAHTGAPSVQAVVHCAGAIAFFMSLASGLLPDVRCVTCSQVALHYRVPAATRVKSVLHVPDLVRSAGLDYLSPTEDPKHPVFQSMFGELVDLVHHECSSTVCHRITFLYGHLYRHDRMNAETHERLGEQFGKCNITAFQHLGQLTRRGTAARFDHGAAENTRRYGTSEPPTYLDPSHLRIPITFVSGEKNETFLPTSTELTFGWLRAANPDIAYQRHVVPGYGHIDTFMGARARTDTFPLFMEQLEACPA